MQIDPFLIHLLREINDGRDLSPVAAEARKVERESIADDVPPKAFGIARRRALIFGYLNNIRELLRAEQEESGNLFALLAPRLTEDQLAFLKELYWRRQPVGIDNQLNTEPELLNPSDLWSDGGRVSKFYLDELGLLTEMGIVAQVVKRNSVDVQRTVMQVGFMMTDLGVEAVATWGIF